MLAERGQLAIPDLLSSTRAGLTRLLHAIRDLQQFQLIEFLPEGNLVGLTGAGSKTATAVKSNEIRSSASRLLKEEHR